MTLEIILIIIGFILLIKGADLLVDGASNIAKKFNIPEIVIGLTIVSIGTSMPELVVSLTSAIEGHPDIAIGNVVGSNMSNLFLILGACATINGLVFKKQTRLIENPLTLISIILLLFFANNIYQGKINVITRIEGAILLIGCMLFIIYNIMMAKRETYSQTQYWITFNSDRNEKSDILKSIICIILGILGLKFGGDIIIDNSVLIATKLGMSEKLISLTIIAVATSLPELITSVTAAIQHENDMAIGNILGSQIFNILLIIGASAVIAPITYSVSYNRDLFILLGGACILAILPYIGKKNQMTRTSGIIYLAIYAIYINYLIFDNI